MKRTRYKRPRKINWVSLLIAALGAALVYAAVMFTPPYWRKWKVKGTLDDLAHRYYKGRRATGPEEADMVTRLRELATSRIRALGVDDAGLKLFFHKVPGKIQIRAEYKELVRHPLVHRVTTLHFRPHVSMEYSSGHY